MFSCFSGARDGLTGTQTHPSTRACPGLSLSAERGDLRHFQQRQPGVGGSRSVKWNEVERAVDAVVGGFAGDIYSIGWCRWENWGKGKWRCFLFCRC